MQLFIVGFRRRFMTQKIAVCTCLLQFSVTLIRSFSQRQGDSTIRMVDFYLTDYVTKPRIVEKCIFSALEHESPKSQFIPFPAAVQNLFFAEPVAVTCLVAAADSTVKTVISAEVADFNEAADEHLLAVILLPHLIRFHCQLLCQPSPALRHPLRFQHGQKLQKFHRIQHLGFRQLFNQCESSAIHDSPLTPHWSRRSSRKSPGDGRFCRKGLQLCPGVHRWQC